MKLFAIGNALVDTIIEDTNGLIETLELEKGTMTLMSDSQRKELLPAVQNFIKQKSAGGSAANTMITAQLLGTECHLTCKVGKDENGTLFINELDGLNVTHNYMNQAPPEDPTGTCLVFITPDAERTMSTYLGVSASISSADVSEPTIAGSDICYIEGYLVSSPSGFSAAKTTCELSKKHGKKIGLTFSDINMIRYFRNEMSELVAFEPNYLFCNAQEAFEYTGTQSLTEAGEVLIKKAEVVIITNGSEGAYIITNNETIHIASIPTQAIDTNGAGDTYAGAFLAGISQGLSLKESGELASKAASRVVSINGPRLSNKDLYDLKIEQSAI